MNSLKLKTLGIAMSLAMTGAGVAYATPVPITNGDFSQITLGTHSTAGQDSYRINPTTGQPSSTYVTVNGWTVGGGQAVWYQSAATALDPSTGFRLANVIAPPSGSGGFVGLNGDPLLQGSIGQQLTGLTVGGNYIVSFDWAASQQNGVSGPTTDYLQVSLGNQSHSTDALSIASHGFDGWNHVSFGFTAQSESAFLNFLAFGTPVGLPPMALISGVTVDTPEPPELAIFGGGLLALGFITVFARRRALRNREADDGAAA